MGPRGSTDAQKGLGSLRAGTSVVADVIKDRGKYGRVAEKWFSKAGWKATASGKQSMNSEEDLTREQKRQGIESLPNDIKPSEESAPGKGNNATQVNQEAEEEAAEQAEKAVPPPNEDILQSLTPRILGTTKLFFASKSFYFSYDHDISHSLSNQEPGSSTLPLYTRFDPLVCGTYIASFNAR